MSVGFVTEQELDAKRQKRQEEWEKVRTAEDPKEVPEEPYDSRSLYDRLREQKEKKEAEVAEQFAIRNLVKGLEDDEADYLDSVDRKRSELDALRRREDMEMLAELKDRILCEHSTTLPDPDQPPPPPHTSTSSTSSPPPPVIIDVASLSSTSSSRPSQRKLIGQLIKRKRSAVSESNEARTEDEKQTAAECGVPEKKACAPSAAQVVGCLPGIVGYDSDDDESITSSSSDDDDDHAETQSPC